MGTWGAGPFDSDEALDFCAHLVPLASHELYDTLNETLTNPHHQPGETWAGIALVVGGLDYEFGDIDISYGEDYLGLLTTTDATTLVDSATAAVEALLAHTIWLSSWNDGGVAVEEHLHYVKNLLTEA